MRFRSQPRRDHPEVNLIAFIDVLLVILIFLMVSTTFTRFSALQITLPTADADARQSQPRTLTVAIDADGGVAIDGRRTSVREPGALVPLLQSVAQADPESVVEIRADALATHQSVVNVMEAARLAGLPRIVFATQSGGAAR